MALPTYTTIAASAIQANAPLTTDLANDWTDNTEHVRQTVYDPAVHTPKIAHDHNGINSSLVNVPISEAISVALWNGVGGGSNVIVANPPSKKDIGIVLVNPSTSRVSGAIFFKAVTAVDALDFDAFANITEAVIVGSLPDNPHIMHIRSPGPLNSSGARYAAYLFSEVVGICAIGTYTGDAVDDRQVDISATSHSGQPDFQPDVVFVWRTDASEDARIRTVDHTANTSSDLEDGVLVTNGIKAFNSNGFTLGTGNGNTSGGEYKYMALKIGSGNGLSVEKVVSPQDATEQEVPYVDTIGYPFMAFAIETTGPSPTLGIHWQHMWNRVGGASTQQLGKQIDASSETDTQGIKMLGKTSVRVGTAFPNSNLANIQNSSIWILRASPIVWFNNGDAQT